MKKPKSVQDLLLGILMILGLAVVAYGAAALLQGEVTPGEYDLRCGEQVVRMTSCVIEETVKNGEPLRYAPLDPETDGENFPVVKGNYGLSLIPTQEPIEKMYFTVYKSDFTELYYRSEVFIHMEEPGEYYLILEAGWGRDDHYFITQHGVKLIVE